jgi:hypothetical protein
MEQFSSQNFGLTLILIDLRPMLMGIHGKSACER